MDPSAISREALKQALTASGVARFTFAEAGSPEEARFRFDAAKTDIAFLAFDRQTALSTAFRLVGDLRLEQKRPLLIVLVGSERSVERLGLLDVDHSLVRPARPKTIETQLAPLLKTIRSAR